LSEDLTKTQVTGIKQESKSDRLFFKQEINDIVKEFIRAYVRGQIKLDLSVSVEPFRNMGSLSDETLASHPLFLKSLELRNGIINMISICSGIKNSTEEQYQDAINNLFVNILILRMTYGIEGSFYSNDIESQFKLIINDLTEIKKDNELYKQKIYQVLEYVERLDPSIKGGK
jgi:hypothetical protein